MRVPPEAEQNRARQGREQSYSLSHWFAVLAILLLSVTSLASCSDLGPVAKQRLGTTKTPPPQYYVDCSAEHAGNGTSKRPWNTLSPIHDHGAFGAGAQILLRRGTRCVGQLAPLGSGSPTHPNVIGAWGTGARPIIDAQGSTDRSGAVELRDVHDWIVQDLAVTNAAPSVDRTFRAGILVRNSAGGVLHGITVRRNLIFG